MNQARSIIPIEDLKELRRVNFKDPDLFVEGVILGSDITGAPCGIYIPTQNRGYIGSSVDLDEVKDFLEHKLDDDSLVPVGLYRYSGVQDDDFLLGDLEMLRKAVFPDEPFYVVLQKKPKVPEIFANANLGQEVFDMCFDSTYEFLNREKLLLQQEYFKSLSK